MDNIFEMSCFSLNLTNLTVGQFSRLETLVQAESRAREQYNNASHLSEAEKLEIARSIQQNNSRHYINAIKMYRQRTGASLKVAKTAVDDAQQSLS